MNPKRVVVIGDVMLDVIVQPTQAGRADERHAVQRSRGPRWFGRQRGRGAGHCGHDVIYVGVVGNDFAGDSSLTNSSSSGVTPQLERWQDHRRRGRRLVATTDSAQ